MLVIDRPDFQDFIRVKSTLGSILMDTPLERREKWQQLEVGESDNHLTHELSNVVISMDRIPQSLTFTQLMIGPDLPWAEDHFQERVGGEPINPGKAHAYWPYHGESINLTLRQMESRGEYYDHNYMERMWCKGLANFGGYRFEVGDLGSVIQLLQSEPTTRQAYLPIWFPEDTGVRSGQRVPCTLGYHFIKTGGRLHLSYFLRACEWYRHFTNDVYLAVRLLQHVSKMTEIHPGSYTMHISNLHLFKGDERYVSGK